LWSGDIMYVATSTTSYRYRVMRNNARKKIGHYKSTNDFPKVELPVDTA